MNSTKTHDPIKRRDDYGNTSPEINVRPYPKDHGVLGGILATSGQIGSYLKKTGWQAEKYPTHQPLSNLRIVSGPYKSDSGETVTLPGYLDREEALHVGGDAYQRRSVISLLAALEGRSFAAVQGDICGLYESVIIRDTEGVPVACIFFGVLSDSVPPLVTDIAKEMGLRTPFVTYEGRTDGGRDEIIGYARSVDDIMRIEGASRV